MKKTSAGLLASLVLLSANGASAIFCPTLVTEVTVRSNGTVFMKGDRTSAAICVISGATADICSGMLRLLEGALLSKNEITFNVTAGTCAAPTTIEYVKLND